MQNVFKIYFELNTGNCGQVGRIKTVFYRPNLECILLISVTRDFTISIVKILQHNYRFGHQ